jgi:hypothetical protein
MMFDELKVGFGAFLILVGFGYIFRYDIVERIRAFIREYMLNDAYIALERRKWGLFFLLMGTLFMYMGITSLQNLPKP